MPNSNIPLPKQVRFASSITHNDDNESAKTDKIHNLRRGRRKSRRITGVRSKFILEAMRQELYHLQTENEKLRKIVIQRVNPVELAESILLECESPPVDIFLRSSMVMEEDETKGGEEEESYVTPTVPKNLKASKSLPRIGHEMEPLRVPIKELLIPETKGRDDRSTKSYIVERSFEFDIDKDEAQCLVEAFAGEFAF